MKALRTKVMLSAFVLLFALVATIGSTYAWFTVSSTVSVSTLNINVTTADSLLIKIAPFATAIDATASGADVDPSTYGTTVSQAQLITAGYNITTYTIQPVTTVKADYTGITASIFNSMNADIDARPLTALTPSSDFNSATGYAIQLKFWVMAQTTTDLKLNTFNITGTSASSTVNTAVQNATKIAITSRGNTAGLIFGNNMDYTYSFAGTPKAAVVSPDTAINAISDHTGYSTDSGVAFNGTVTTFTGTAGDVIQSLVANVPVIVIATIYVEGWNADTTNYIIGAPMNITFSFTII